MRRYRALRGDMSQETLARTAGVSLATVQAAEQGKYKPKFANAKAYDDALEADGEVLAAFGYAATNGRPSIDEVVSRLVKVEAIGDAGVPAIEELGRELAALHQRVERVEAEVRALKRRRPPRASADG